MKSTLFAVVLFLFIWFLNPVAHSAEAKSDSLSAELGVLSRMHASPLRHSGEGGNHSVDLKGEMVLRLQVVELGFSGTGAFWKNEGRTVSKIDHWDGWIGPLIGTDTFRLTLPLGFRTSVGWGKENSTLYKGTHWMWGGWFEGYFDHFGLIANHTQYRLVNPTKKLSVDDLEVANKMGPYSLTELGFRITPVSVFNVEAKALLMSMAPSRFEYPQSGAEPGLARLSHADVIGLRALATLSFSEKAPSLKIFGGIETAFVDQDESAILWMTGLHVLPIAKKALLIGLKGEL